MNYNDNKWFGYNYHGDPYMEEERRRDRYREDAMRMAMMQAQLWAQPPPFYSSPVLTKQPNRKLLLLCKSN